MAGWKLAQITFLALVIPPQSLPSPVFRSIGKYFVTRSYDFDFFNCTVHKGDTRHQLQNLTTIKLISNTGKKRERKEKEKNNDYQKFALKRFESGPSEVTKPKFSASLHWPTSAITNTSLLKEVYILSQWWLTVFKNDLFGFRVELYLSLIKARCKAHKKKTLILFHTWSMQSRLKNLWTIDRAATEWTVWPYDRSGKTYQHNIVHRCSHCFKLG